MSTSIKNKLIEQIKHFFQRCWTPPDRKESLYNYRITFIGIVIAIIALVFGYIQLKTAFDNLEISQKQLRTQLGEFNAKAKIELKVRFTKSTIYFGPEVSEPIEIMIIPRNKGNYNTPTWEAGFVFCSSVNVLEYDSDWEKINDKIFIYKSKGKVLFEKAVFNNWIDSIGNFKITFPGKNYLRDDQIVPLGLFTTYGEKTEQVNTFTYLDLNREKDVQYEPIIINDNNSELLTDIKGCLTFTNTN